VGIQRNQQLSLRQHYQNREVPLIIESPLDVYMMLFEEIVNNYKWIPIGYLSSRYPNVKGRISLDLLVIKVEQGSSTLVGHTFYIF